jgi:DnaJ-class molecular chaperone
LHEAICGFRTTVQSLDGRPLRIEAANVTPETVKIIPGEGMPNTKVSTAPCTPSSFVTEVRLCLLDAVRTVFETAFSISRHMF